jgi:hypothetical protein
MSERTEQLFEQMIVQLDRIAREQTEMRKLISKFVYAMVDQAESEIPEKYRRFTNTMHDIHDIKYMYEDVGSAVPPHILRACERFDDRFRQIEKDMNAEGGVFSKVRRDMASRPDAWENRWDHTRLLYPPKKEKVDETGKSE